MENRLYLRPLEEADVTDRYLNGFSDDDVLSFLEVDGKNLEKQDVVDYMKHGRESQTFYMYAICSQEDDTHFGNLKIGPIDREKMESDLVTVIWDKEYWGKGLATDAIKKGNELAFNEFNIRKLKGGIYEDNLGSIKAYTRAGWVIEDKIPQSFMHRGELIDVVKVIVSCVNPDYES